MMKFTHPVVYSGWLALVISITACSTQIPREISEPLDGAPGVGEVRATPDAFVSQKVRWGGVILGTENRQDASRVTIVTFPLGDDGAPQVSGQSTGRFIASFDAFLEPLVFAKDREITVTGTVLKTETLDVGEYAYAHPVVQVEQYYLWPEKVDPVYVDYPPDWWYDPWYPYFPYFPHHHHRHW
jgi:outer membrane lipoprotein